jgi:molybdopterin converting factor small subunit
VLLFAGLAERAGAREWRLDDVPERATVGTLLASLRARHPFLGGVPVAVARNQSLAREGESIADGDEIALLPPVSGG